MKLNDRLRSQIQRNLKAFQRCKTLVGAGRQAAVALTITDVSRAPNIDGLIRRPVENDAAALILTRRAASLNHHAGQWALPGGRIDVGERPEQSALRELEEEVGLRLPKGCVLGRLDDYATRSGFVIKPVVVWSGCQPHLERNPTEVASIHRIPLAELLRKDAPILHPTADNNRPILMMPIGNTAIAAPTAAVVYQFRQVALLGKNEPVAHYDQPSFAWR